MRQGSMRLVRLAFMVCAATSVAILGSMTAGPASAGNYPQKIYPTVIYPGPAFSRSYDRPVYYGYRHHHRHGRYDRRRRHDRLVEYQFSPMPPIFVQPEYVPIRGGVLLQAPHYPNCRLVDVPYGGTWIRGRDYRC